MSNPKTFDEYAANQGWHAGLHDNERMAWEDGYAAGLAARPAPENVTPRSWRWGNCGLSSTVCVARASGGRRGGRPGRVHGPNLECW